MNYPIFNTGEIGPSTLIAFVAIIHVIIAHFAVGAGIATPWLETRSHRRRDAILGGFLRKYARFLILVSFVDAGMYRLCRKDYRCPIDF